MGPVYMRSCSQALRGIILGERIQGYKKKDRRNMRLLGKSFHSYQLTMVIPSGVRVQGYPFHIYNLFYGKILF